MKKKTDDDICDAVKGRMKLPRPEEKARRPSKSSVGGKKLERRTDSFQAICKSVILKHFP